MSTDLYGVRVISVSGRTAKLQIFQVYYADVDWGPPPGQNEFILKTISPELGFIDVDDSELEDDMMDGDITDDDWLRENVDRYIESVKCLKVTNYPIADPQKLDPFYFHDKKKKGWKDEDKLVSGLFKVTVTDKKWLSHLKAGMSWGTAAAPL